MATQKYYIPLILKLYRIIDVFSRANQEKDFYLNTVDGFLIYEDLGKTSTQIKELREELSKDKYSRIPKMTEYESRKLIEGFVNEKIYDIDVKEKLTDIFQSKDPREQFIEFINDNISEKDRWTQYYKEKMKIKIIEWLRSINIQFVFEEDLDISKAFIEEIKKTAKDPDKKVSDKIKAARKQLKAKAATYYNNDALNPKPKRGRPPKQSNKLEEAQVFSNDVFFNISKVVKPFIYSPTIDSISEIAFSSEVNIEDNFKNNKFGMSRLKNLDDRMESLKKISKKIISSKGEEKKPIKLRAAKKSK